MISWIIATHDQDILRANALASISWPVGAGDEIILVEDAPSITVAYADGQQRAHHAVKCYIHSDLYLLDSVMLRAAILETTSMEEIGIAGLIGARTMAIPWWNGGGLLGSVNDNRLGTLNFGPGGECDVVDGILLATKHYVEWDVAWPGWHGYEYDACTQLKRSGKQNWCLSNGHMMATHNNDSPLDLNAIHGWGEAVSRYLEKWSTHD